jgi:hypothetical protein
MLSHLYKCTSRFVVPGILNYSSVVVIVVVVVVVVVVLKNVLLAHEICNFMYV